jgi:hypothetical protein
MAKKKKIRLSITIEPECVDLMDLYADKLHRSRAEVMRALILFGMDNIETMNAIGVFKIESLRERGVIPRLPLGHYE